MDAEERWLAAMWPKVRCHLPAPPAVVVEVGCGSLGGFVPMLRTSGYDAVGIDPEAPDGRDYHRVELERWEFPHRPQAVVASTSLHHVGDPAEVLDKIAERLTADGVVVVVEWDWERFDEATARWCFERLGPQDEGWLHHEQQEWARSGRSWDGYLRAWVDEEGLHGVETLLRELDQRFVRQHFGTGPYFFPELGGTSETDELAAIEAGEIQANRIDYVGRLAR